MTGQEFRGICLEMPDSFESEHMGHPDFRVKKGIFATLNADESLGVLRMPLDLGEALIQSNSAFAVKGRQKNSIWLGVLLSKVSKSETRELIQVAHEFRCK